jgi:hypothetical protein
MKEITHLIGKEVSILVPTQNFMVTVHGVLRREEDGMFAVGTKAGNILFEPKAVAEVSFNRLITIG